MRPRSRSTRPASPSRLNPGATRSCSRICRATRCSKARGSRGSTARRAEASNRPVSAMPPGKSPSDSAGIGASASSASARRRAGVLGSIAALANSTSQPRGPVPTRSAPRASAKSAPDAAAPIRQASAVTAGSDVCADCTGRASAPSGASGSPSKRAQPSNRQPSIAVGRAVARTSSDGTRTPTASVPFDPSPEFATVKSALSLPARTRPAALGRGCPDTLARSSAPPGVCASPARSKPPSSPRTYTTPSWLAPDCAEPICADSAFAAASAAGVSSRQLPRAVMRASAGAISPGERAGTRSPAIAKRAPIGRVFFAPICWVSRAKTSSNDPSVRATWMPRSGTAASTPASAMRAPRRMPSFAGCCSKWMRALASPSRTAYCASGSKPWSSPASPRARSSSRRRSSSSSARRTSGRRSSQWTSGETIKPTIRAAPEGGEPATSIKPNRSRRGSLGEWANTSAPRMPASGTGNPCVRPSSSGQPTKRRVVSPRVSVRKTTFGSGRSDPSRMPGDDSSSALRTSDATPPGSSAAQASASERPVLGPVEARAVRSVSGLPMGTRGTQRSIRAR